METGELSQASFQEATKTARERGRERRRKLREGISQRINSVLGRIREGANSMVDLAFGAPDLGKWAMAKGEKAVLRTVEKGKEKGGELKEKTRELAVEAFERAQVPLIEARNAGERFAQRVGEGINRFRERVKKARNEAVEKARSIAERAKALGVRTLEGVEERVKRIMEIPADIQEMVAQIQYARAERLLLKQERTEERYTKEIQKLLREMERANSRYLNAAERVVTEARKRQERAGQIRSRVRGWKGLRRVIARS